MKTLNGRVEVDHGSDVKITIHLQDLSVEGVDLCLIFVFLCFIGIDGALEALSSCFKGLIVSLQCGFVVVDGIDLVIKGHIVGIEDIDVLGECRKTSCILKESC